MPTVVLTTRMPRLLGKDTGITVCPILEGEGYNGFLVCSVDPGSPADGRLRPGDRILMNNGVPSINYSKFMEGMCHQFRINTIDSMLLRHYPHVGGPREWELTMPKEAALFLVKLETDCTVYAAPLDSGLQKGDLLLEVDGAAVKDAGEAQSKMGAGGATVKVKVVRGKLPPKADAILPAAERSPHSEYFVAHVNPAIIGQRPLGLFARDLDNCAVVCNADAGTAACESGLIPLDRVLSINETRIRSVGECAAAIKKSGYPFWMLVERVLSIPHLVHDNKRLTPSMGVSQPYALPATPEDIAQIQSKLATEKAKGDPSANIPLRSISKEALRCSSKESTPAPIPSSASPRPPSTETPDSAAPVPAKTLNVNFDQKQPNVHEIAQDVEPRKRRQRPQASK